MNNYSTFQAYLEDTVGLPIFPYTAPIPSLHPFHPQMVEEFEMMRIQEEGVHAELIAREAINYFNGRLDEGCSVLIGGRCFPEIHFSSSNQLRYLVCITPFNSSICVGVQDSHLYSSRSVFS